jgi:hypothetical protein
MVLRKNFLSFEKMFKLKNIPMQKMFKILKSSNIKIVQSWKLFKQKMFERKIMFRFEKCLD